VRSALALESRFVGGLPLVKAILDRLTVDCLLEAALPSGGRVSPARALGVLLRNIVLNDRQPIYTHAEWADRAEPGLIGLTEGQAACLNDDRVGRALDRLFDADRAALLTEIVLRTIREFEVELDQLHNDSTTLTLTGEYRDAQGREVRGQPTLVVTYGHNQDHRPDLVAAAVRPDGLGGWRGADPLPGAGWEHQRLDDAHRDVGDALPSGGAAGLPVRGGLQAVLEDDAGTHRQAQGTVHHRASEEPARGQVVPDLHPDP
jgi:hypothetical protein